MDNDLHKDLSILIDQALNLQGRGLKLVADSRLAGALPELDSMGVLNLINALETQFGVEFDDQEIDEAVFRTLGTLSDFLVAKLHR